MRKRFLVGRSLAVVAVSVWMVTCGDPQTHNPLKPSGPAVSSAEITGPAAIVPGQSAQFTVRLHFTEGTVKTATGVVWSSNSPVLQVNSSGVATASPQTGEAVLSVSVPLSQGSPLKASREVLILPEGTYRLVGKVMDADFPLNFVAGARLDVTPGSASATADSTGNYKLYGVPPDASIHIAKDGYQPFEQNIHLTGNAIQTFFITSANPIVRLGGPYTVAIDAAPGCSGPGALPEDLQHRSYQATVTQNGLILVVTLTEPRFRIVSGLGNHFYGSSKNGGAGFYISGFFGLGYYGYYYYPDLVERLSDGTVLLVAGGVTTTGTAASLSGHLNGELSNWSATFPNGTKLGGCSSSAHQFTLTPR